MNEQHVSAWGSVWFQLTLPIRDAGERLTLRYISSLCAILPYVASQTATHSDQLVKLVGLAVNPRGRTNTLNTLL